MPATITLVRHAETAANAAGRWQGAGNTPFSERGCDQLARLVTRLVDPPADIVIASDLGRAEASVRALGLDYETDARWREPSVGGWEGLSFEEIRAQNPAQLMALLDGEDVPLGGGERLSEVADRLVAAFTDLVGRVGEDGTALVVSHGIALLTLVPAILGVARPAPLQLMANTAVTTFSINAHGPHMVRYNDTSHLAGHPPVRPGETTLVLVRHGETVANVERRWQGHSDWPLTEVGERQATRAAAALPPVDAVYTSPLTRAAQTAADIGELQGLPVVVDERLMEIGFGGWENLTSAEIEATDPAGYARLNAGEDIVRGSTGETFLSVRQRMSEAMADIAGRHPGGTVAVVCHGGASRAYVTGVLGMGFTERLRIGSLDNTAFGRVVYGERGPVLGAWNMAPHLGVAGDTP